MKYENDITENPERNGKRKKKSSPLLIILIILLLGVFLFSAYKVITIVTDYKKSDNYYEDLRSDAIVTAGEDDKKESLPAETAEVDGNKTSESVTDAPFSWPDEPISVNFDYLHSVCPDVVGWLFCGQTMINYPVVQYTDNEYYLRRALDGSDLVTGTIFVDCICGDIGDDMNYIIYGHYMHNGAIFGCFEYFKNQSYYDTHKTMKYFTPEKTYVIELFSCFKTDIHSELYNVNFNSVGEFAKVISDAKAASWFTSDVTVDPEVDHIVTFSTCTSYGESDDRYLLIGKLTELN